MHYVNCKFHVNFYLIIENFLFRMGKIEYFNSNLNLNFSFLPELNLIKNSKLKKLAAAIFENDTT